MKSHITNFIIWSLAVAFGWVTGRMMELFLPPEVLIGITAVTIPLTIIIAVMIIGNLREQKKLKSLMIRTLEKHLRAGKDDGS